MTFGPYRPALPAIRLHMLKGMFFTGLTGVFVSAEELTPIILATQQQFKFTHICAGASAFGKVRWEI